ncbi:MarR family transcriptional regulator [Boseaceae bacterium BT-24-1]|nr:MarR family transcriptional regulator [Boseaceae bacterium BT-24-1]
MHHPEISTNANLVDEDRTEGPTLGEIGLQHFVPYLMNRIMGAYNGSLRDDLARLGLTTPKMRTLAVLSVTDGLAIGRLAVYAIAEQSTLSRAVDALEGEGLVRRSPDPGDSRATRVFITEKGRTVFDRIWPTIRRAYEKMFAGIDAAERAAFTATLQKLLVNVRKEDF